MCAYKQLFSFQPFLRREKYKLFVCFYEALMVSETDGPVEFEVSIGEYCAKSIQQATFLDSFMAFYSKVIPDSFLSTLMLESENNQLYKSVK